MKREMAGQRAASGKMSHSPSLPRSPHPLASAFFASHDHATRGDAPPSSPAKAGPSPRGDGICRGGRRAKCDERIAPGGLVARIRDSAGWRNRYASSVWHPVSVIPVSGREGSFGGGEDARQAELCRSRETLPSTFHVRQVLGVCEDAPEDADADAARTVCASERTPSASNCAADDFEIGTGATVWPGSIVLLKYLERIAHGSGGSDVLCCKKGHVNAQQFLHNNLKGKSVVDLGSGTAITTIAAALLGASLVVCTDGCDPVVKLACKNVADAISELKKERSIDGEISAMEQKLKLLDVESNMTQFHVRGCNIFVGKYLWGDGTLVRSRIQDRTVAKRKPPRNVPSQVDQRSIPSDQCQEKRQTYFDIILCADCIVPKLYPITPLIDALDELAGPETVAYLSYERRHYEHFDPKAEFLRLANLRAFEVETVPDHELHPMYYASDIEIWKVSRRRRTGGNGDQIIETGGSLMETNEGSQSRLVGKHRAEFNDRESPNCAWTNTPGIKNDHASLLVQSRSK